MRGVIYLYLLLYMWNNKGKEILKCFRTERSIAFFPFKAEALYVQSANSKFCKTPTVIEYAFASDTKR